MLTSDWDDSSREGLEERKRVIMTFLFWIFALIAVKSNPLSQVLSHDRVTQKNFLMPWCRGKAGHSGSGVADSNPGEGEIQSWYKHSTTLCKSWYENLECLPLSEDDKMLKEKTFSSQKQQFLFENKFLWKQCLPFPSYATNYKKLFLIKGLGDGQFVGYNPKHRALL